MHAIKHFYFKAHSFSEKTHKKFKAVNKNKEGDSTNELQHRYLLLLMYNQKHLYILYTCYKNCLS